MYMTYTYDILTHRSNAYVQTYLTQEPAPIVSALGGWDPGSNASEPTLL
jgi:hypothetical protein